MSRPTILASLFFREAIRALLRHKVRSGLSVLGIMVGVAAVVLVVGVGDAGSARAQAQLAALGDNLVWVEAGSRNVAGVRTGTHGMLNLTIEDAEAIRREVPEIRSVSPQVDGTVVVRFGNKTWTTRWRGETPEYLQIRSWRVALGQSFSQDDVDRQESKVLLGETVRQQLFGGANPVGEVIQIQRMLFEVVGVLAAKGQSAEGRDQDDWILLPWTTGITKIRGRSVTRYLDDIMCSARSAEAVPAAIDRITALLRERHAIAPGADDDFNIRRPDEVLKAQVEAQRTLSFLLVSIAAVSLLVGGIGIMNVMLASVVQRTHEIGVRLAVGATTWAILAQFLGEAVALTVIGGLLGIGLSVAGAFAFARFLDWPIGISPQALVVAIACSASIGVFFGFYPARRASRLDPIVALRSD